METDLTSKVNGGTVDLRRIGRLSDEQVVERLTQVKGIGRWTAQMFLIFSLGRPDVFPQDVLEEPDQEAATEAGCPRCGSKKLIRDVTVADQGESSDGTLEVVVFRNPEALIFKDCLTGEIRADICGSCGHIEFRVANPGQLYQHYQKARGLDRPASRKGLYAAPCVRCGMLVVSGSSCPHCGASQMDS